MKKFKHLALLLLAAFVVFGCSKYDDTDLRNDVSDLQSRVEKLEKWCETTNTQISALQGMVAALEAKDFVTGVTPITEGAETTGYTITFSKSGAVTIKNGTNGKDGLNGVTPIIGVAKHTDDLYYWTVKTGDAAATWMLDADGKMIRTTGDKGADGSVGTTPVLSVATDTDGKLYWKVNSEWLLNDGKKVPATGDKGDKGETGADGSDGADGKDGDSIFKKDGIDLTDPNNVTFTLNDGKDTKITFPRTSTVKIFDSFDNFKIAVLDAATDLTLALNIKDAEYKAIKAELTSSAGLTTAIKTRATAAPWEVAITAPTFKDGSVDVQPKVSITPKDAVEGDVALLKVTIIDTKGDEHASTRVILYSTKVDVESVTIAETLALVVNEEKSLTATVLPAGATQTVTWTTSDATIVTVDASGKVKGMKAGTATIKATSTDNSAKFDECVVTVSTVAVTSIVLADKSVSIGAKVTLTATIAPADATIKTVTWSSSDAAIATINATTGEVTGVAKGETTITATSTSNPTVTATCKVTVEEKPSITWAAGNLVANGANGAKIGTATDGGLFFQFGSLVGWSTAGSPTIAVKPAVFNGKEGWAETGKIWQGTEGTVPFTIKDSGSDNEKAGIGDPCRYYLGDTWRLPTKDEYVELFKNQTEFSSTSSPWKWENASATNSTKNLTFPASGCRVNFDGGLFNVGTYGYYWSASPRTASNGYYLRFYSSYVNPSLSNLRALGLPVRCVK